MHVIHVVRVHACNNKLLIFLLQVESQLWDYYNYVTPVIEEYYRVCFSGLGVQVEPHKRQLHITMAHQYPAEQHSKLEELAQSLVEPTLPAKWELRLYSRDIRLAMSEVRKN